MTGRITILLIFAVGAAFAAPVISVNNSGTVPCISGEGISGLGTEEAVASASAYYGEPQWYDGNAGGYCQVTVSDELITTGDGPGYLTFTLSGEDSGNGGPGGYLELNGRYYTLNGSIPITLGTAFDIVVGANAEWAGQGCCFNASSMQVTISAYDENIVESQAREQGADRSELVEEFSAPSGVPEPGTGWLLLGGVAIASLMRRYLLSVRWGG